MLEPFSRPGCRRHVLYWNPSTGLGGEGRFQFGNILLGLGAVGSFHVGTLLLGLGAVGRFHVGTLFQAWVQ